MRSSIKRRLLGGCQTAEEVKAQDQIEITCPAQTSTRMVGPHHLAGIRAEAAWLQLRLFVSCTGR